LSHHGHNEKRGENMHKFELGEEPQHRETKYVKVSSLSFWNTGTIFPFLQSCMSGCNYV